MIFFALTSSAFAHIEKSKLVPGYEQLSQKETFEKVAKAQTDLKVLDKLQGYAVAANSMIPKENTWYYHLIVLNTDDRTVNVESFSREGLKEAMTAYGKAEMRASMGEKIDPVLVSAGPLEQLRKAYPNYFLDTRDFVKSVRSIISKAEDGSKTTQLSRS